MFWVLGVSGYGNLNPESALVRVLLIVVRVAALVLPDAGCWFPVGAIKKHDPSSSLLGLYDNKNVKLYPTRTQGVGLRALRLGVRLKAAYPKGSSRARGGILSCSITYKSRITDTAIYCKYSEYSDVHVRVLSILVYLHRG